MPAGGRAPLSVARHLELARDNAEVFVVLLRTAEPVLNWAGTALFYSAVHYTDAILRKAGLPVAGNHDERWRQLTDVRLDAKLISDDFIAHYLALKDLSQKWRYLGVASSVVELQQARNGHHLPIAQAAAKATG